MSHLRLSDILVRWRQTSILTAATLSVLAACSGLAEIGVVTRQYQSDVLKRDKPHVRSLQSALPLQRPKDMEGYSIDSNNQILEEHNKIDENHRKNGDIRPMTDTETGNSKSKQNDHVSAKLSAGFLDTNVKELKPRFKNTEKMFQTELKPAGSTAKFRCAAEGNPTPNITWYKNGETPPVRQLGLGSIKHNKWGIVLEDLIAQQDTGNYTCVICNSLGCIDFTYYLSVMERYPSKPYIKESYPGNQTVLINDTVVFECPPISDMEPYVYWLSITNGTVFDLPPNDEVIPDGTLPKIKSENPDDSPETLTLYNVRKEQTGWYICIAVNTLGNDSAKGYLTVLDSYPLIMSKDAPQNSYVVNMLTSVLGVVLFLVAAIVVIFILKKLKRTKMKQLAMEAGRDVIVTHWTKKVTVEKQNAATNAQNKEPLLMPVVKIEKQKLSKVQSNTSDPMMISEYELPEDIDWEVPREKLSLGKILGEGAFGKVVKADCVVLLKPGVRAVVAVKMLKEDHNDAEMMALVSEMEIMKMIGKHINIINLLGCCSQGGPLYVIVEYALHGNLREFLRSHRQGDRHRHLRYKSTVDDYKDKISLTQKYLVSFSCQVARGMEYLASRRCIHRDLAARNVLVSEDFVLKIADFGLAKDVRSSDYYRKKTEGLLPVRWMAPESLHQLVFTTQTDVWSFGVLLWEIMTLGCTPYSNVRGQYMYKHLKSGHRMEKPPSCSLQIYMLMRECWYFQPNDRPSFSELVENLEKNLAITDNQEKFDLSLPQIGTPILATPALERKTIATPKGNIVRSYPPVDEEEQMRSKKQMKTAPKVSALAKGKGERKNSQTVKIPADPKDTGTDADETVRLV